MAAEQMPLQSRNHQGKEPHLRNGRTELLIAFWLKGNLRPETQTQLLSTNERVTVLPRFQGKMVNKCPCVFLFTDQLTFFATYVRSNVRVSVGVCICVGSDTALPTM